MPSAITTSSDNMSDSEIIALNVGGVVYTTTRSTLTKYPDSMLGAMFNGSMNPSILDKDGRFFIDRDGQMFKFVLEFLRSGKLSLADDSTEKEGLLAEAEYYQLMPLIAKLHDDKGHILDVYKWPTVSECHVIIHGTTTALSKVPPVYIDMQNRLKLQNYLKETEEGEDKSEMITLKFPCSFPDLEKDKMYINFERALKDYGWIKSEYNPLPYFTHDDMYKRNQAGIRGRTAWYHV